MRRKLSLPKPFPYSVVQKMIGDNPQSAFGRIRNTKTRKKAHANIQNLKTYPKFRNPGRNRANCGIIELACALRLKRPIPRISIPKISSWADFRLRGNKSKQKMGTKTRTSFVKSLRNIELSVHCSQKPLCAEVRGQSTSSIDHPPAETRPPQTPTLLTRRRRRLEEHHGQQCANISTVA